MIYNYVGQPFPITDPQTAVGQQAKSLWERAADLDGKVDEAEAKAYHAQRAVRTAQEALREHLQASAMDGKAPTKEKALSTALKAAEASADQPWAERQEAARRAASVAEGELAAFLTANGTALLEEMRPEAEAVAEGVAVAVGQLLAVLKDYDATGARVTALTGHVQGIDGRDVVNASEWADGLQAALRSVTEGDGIPAPFVREAIFAWAKGDQEDNSVDLDAVLNPGQVGR
jgi:hypothetical protein